MNYHCQMCSNSLTKKEMILIVEDVNCKYGNSIICSKCRRKSISFQHTTWKHGLEYEVRYA